MIIIMIPAGWMPDRQAGDEMAWISVHESVDGPKLRNLYKRLKCSKFEATGILNFLWFWGLTNADREGRILYADNEDIECYFAGAGVGCLLSPKDIVTALFETGWLDETDHGIYIHDWSMWQEQWYKAKERREADTLRKRERRKNKATESDEITFEEIIGDESRDDGEDEKKPAPKPPSSDGKPTNVYTPDFEEFWKAYPRRVDKGMAYKKYQARLNDGFLTAQLLEAAKEYAKQCKRLGTEEKFIKHPKTFLGDATPFTEFLTGWLREEVEIEEAQGKNPFSEY